MSKTKLTFRRATMDDCRLFWRLRNERTSLKHYFSAKPVPWTIHQQWFAAKQKNAKSHLFVLESGKKPVGQIRLEMNGHKSGEIHIVLDKKARGKGFGPLGIAAVSDTFLKSGKARTVTAHIKPNNTASVMAFLRAGFSFDKWIKVKGVSCYQMVKAR